MKLIAFAMDRKTNVINLSRIAFEDLKMAKPSAKSTSQMVFIKGQDYPALCVCFASVAEDKLHEAEGHLYPVKSLQAIMHQQEYELKVANLCHLMDVPFIRSQVVNNRWSFTTRPEAQANMEQSSLGFSSSYSIFPFYWGIFDIYLLCLLGPSKYSTPRKSILTRGVASPANVSASAGNSLMRSTSRYSLSSKDTGKSPYVQFHILHCLPPIAVPIFDGRHHQIDIPSGLRNVPRSSMPLFPGEIPYDSVVLIGYSTAAYRSKNYPDDMTVSLNIVWVVVLASPEDP